MQQVTALTQVLYEALERQDAQQVLSTQQNLTAVAELIWSRVKVRATCDRRYN
jgi:hypothetical protein